MRTWKYLLAPADLRLVNFNYLAGDEAFAGVTLAFAAGDGLEVIAAGLLPGLGGLDEAGRRPRLLGLLRMFAAKLFTIFASDNATSTRAAFKISFR